MRAILTCVDYSKFLRRTLPYNYHHFTEVNVITSNMDHDTRELCHDLLICGEVPNLKITVTDAFYRNGAAFNKYLALEEGLDWMGREGWICIMDADVVWPKDVGMKECHNVIEWTTKSGDMPLYQTTDTLVTPPRRMAPALTSVPDESTWTKYPIHRLYFNQPKHFSGYSQIFHASSKYLVKPPWHRIDLGHAGAGDTFFMEKWPASNRMRPKWECLHLGTPRINWAGVSEENRELLSKSLKDRETRGGRDPMHWGSPIEEMKKLE